MSFVGVLFGSTINRKRIPGLYETMDSLGINIAGLYCIDDLVDGIDYRGNEALESLAGDVIGELDDVRELSSSLFVLTDKQWVDIDKCKSLSFRLCSALGRLERRLTTLTSLVYDRCDAVTYGSLKSQTHRVHQLIAETRAASMLFKR